MDHPHLETSVHDTLLRALAEDRASFDITSLACIPEGTSARAHVLLKQNSKVAGLRFLPLLCKAVDPTLSCQCIALDGEELSDGSVLARIEGSAHALLSLERTALNLLQHASGIADLTSRFVKAIKGHTCDILDTRKTLPGLRALQKYAVAIGGGKNHRFDLQEQFLIKNNHLKLLSATTSRPVREAVQRAKLAHPGHRVEIEVETLGMLEAAMDAGADRILLDNMPPSLVAEAVQIARGKVYLEASGGITLANVAAYAATGVNGISIGALTHSVKAVDISLKVDT